MSLTVASTDLKTNLGHYLDLLSQGVMILITRNGKIVGKMTNAVASPVDAITGILEGKLPDNYGKEDIRNERLGLQ